MVLIIAEKPSLARNIIEGVGEKSTTALLRHFRTLANIRKASLDEIAEIVGKSRAQKVIAHLSK